LVVTPTAQDKRTQVLRQQGPGQYLCITYALFPFPISKPVLKTKTQEQELSAWCSDLHSAMPCQGALWIKKTTGLGVYLIEFRGNNQTRVFWFLYVLFKYFFERLSVRGVQKRQTKNCKKSMSKTIAEKIDKSFDVSFSRIFLSY
jgi:hypothetical protein